MKRLLFIFSFFYLSVMSVSAQETLTLENCLEMGIENNLSLQSKRNEMQKGKYGISENRAKLLPQINGFANYNDNIDPPVSVTDGSAYGTPYNVTHTLRYGANAGLQLQMPLYNQTLYITLSIARTMDEMNRLSYEKAREDLILQICKMYYLGQVTAEQIALVKANILRLEELRDITLAFYDNGMAMEVDVKRVNINLENLKVQYDNALAMLEQQLNLLKYIIDYPAEENIALTPVDTENIIPVALTGLSENLYELQLLQSQKQLAEQQKKMIGYGYVPSLNLTGSWMFSAYTDKAYHWFRSGPSNHWFRSYGLGLSLRVPIFDGLDKRYKKRKATIDIENIKIMQENTRKNLQTQYLNATNDLMNNQRNFKKQKDNYLLAEDVYTVTMDRYREGITSMTEVLQDEMRMSEAQNNYISAHYNYRVTTLMLLKLTGRMDSLMVVCRQGNFMFSLNHKTYFAKAGETLFIPEDSLFQVLRESGNVELFILVYQMEPIRDIIGNSVAPMYLYSQLRTEPCYVWNTGDEEEVLKYMSLLDSTLEMEDNTFNRYEQKLLLLGLTYRICSIYNRKLLNLKTSVGHKYEIFIRLIQLIDEYYTEHRGVEFYAGKLCLSPKYLSELSKSVCGYTVQELIFRSIIRKSISLLKNTQKSIQEISDFFNFPNASYFGTFFKKQTGQSPQQYRKG